MRRLNSSRTAFVVAATHPLEQVSRLPQPCVSSRELATPAQKEDPARGSRVRSDPLAERIESCRYSEFTNVISRLWPTVPSVAKLLLTDARKPVSDVLNGLVLSELIALIQ